MLASGDGKELQTVLLLMNGLLALEWRLGGVYIDHYEVWYVHGS